MTREYGNQQHPPDFLSFTDCVGPILSPPPCPPAGTIGPMRFLISADIVKNACSTFVDDLADVSRNGIAS